MLAYESQYQLQLEGLHVQDDLLAVSASRFGGNDWSGELRLFTQSTAEPAWQTLGAVRLESGSCCCLIYNKEQLVACGGDDGDIRLFRVSDNVLQPNYVARFMEHEDLVSCICKDSADSLLVSGSWDKTAKIWDLNTSMLKDEVKVTDQVTGVQFLGSHLLAVAERNGTLTVLDVRDKSTPVAKKILPVSACSLAQSEAFAIVGCGDGTVIEWSSTTDQVQLLRKHSAPVYALSVCPTTRRLISGSDDGFVFELGAIHRDFVRGAAWWNGRPLTSSWDGTIRYADAS